MIKKKIFIILIFIFGSNCSFDTRSGIWSNNEKIEVSSKSKDKILFKEDEINQDEFNKDLLVKTPLIISKKNDSYQTNNSGPIYIIDRFEKKSKYKFSKIKYFDYFNPELIFDNDSLIFFDKKGSIIKFDSKSKNLWKKNHYSKREKKLLPILEISSNKKSVIITDSLANYYAININTGEILWKKSHKSIFISEVKIDKDRFYVVDSNNKLICFSLINGEKIWEFSSDNDFIKSQKKLSLVYDDTKIYFNNSRGDIYSLEKENGNLAWLTNTREDSESIKSFMLKTSKLVLDDEKLFFSNNKNTFFSLDANNGAIEWKQKISSDLKPIIAGNFIFTVSLDKHLFIIEKTTGRIIRITDLFQGIKENKKKNLIMSGFVVGQKKIYLSLNNGKILEVDIKTGKVLSILKISRGKISEPFINNGKMFIVKNDEIIKLN